MKITELRTNHIVTPLGYSYDPLSFSWKVEAEGMEKEQKCARIQIEKSGENIYDSGETTKRLRKVSNLGIKCLPLNVPLSSHDVRQEGRFPELPLFLVLYWMY